MKKILSVILALVIISSLTRNIVMCASATTTIIEDDKIYSTATLEDNFAPDSIIVVLNNQTSLKCKSYS